MKIKPKYIHEVKLGTPQLCPKCHMHNPSGSNLPEECIWCNRKDLILPTKTHIK